MDRLSSAGCEALLSNGGQHNQTLSAIYNDCTEAGRVSSGAGFQICTIFVLYVFLYRFLFHPQLLSYAWGSKYSSLPPVAQRQFRFAHLGMVAKTISFTFIAEPILWVLCKHGGWSDAFISGSSLSKIDVALFAANALAAFYMFEIVFNESMILLYLLHHIGTILLIQGFCWWMRTLPPSADAILSESILRTIFLLWVIFTGPPNIILNLIAILRQIYPQGSKGLFRFYRASSVMYALATAGEAITVFYFIYQNRFLISVNAVTSTFLLQSLFTITKVYINVYALPKHQRPCRSYLARDAAEGGRLIEKQ